MADLIARIRIDIEREIRYARGMQIMHRERYVQYLHDLREAQIRGDWQRAREIGQDLSAFLEELWRLIEKERAAYQRLVAIVSEAAHPPAATTAETAETAELPDEEPANLIHFVRTT